jgi:hypothetical protein
MDPGTAVRTGMLAGEVRTALIQHGGPLPAATVARLLDSGSPARLSSRPSVRAVAAERLTGVDCRLPTGSGRAVRGVGTVRSRLVVTGGRLVQSSAGLLVPRERAERRLPWGYYLAHPGSVEPFTEVPEADLAAGFLDGAPQRAVLDLAALTERQVTDFQSHPSLDRGDPFRTRRTRLRWTAVAAGPDEPPQARFTLVDETVRTLHLVLPGPRASVVGEFCEDLALHDWLLTTLLRLLERGGPDAGSGRGPLLVLGTAVEQLAHLWLPAVRTDEELAPLWAGIEARSGLSRQWAAAVQRIRDLMVLRLLAGERNGHDG